MAMSDGLLLLLGGMLGYALGAPDGTVFVDFGGLVLAIIARSGLQVSYAGSNRLTQRRLDEMAGHDRRREINRRITSQNLSRHWPS
jgi:hypothetical protein